MFSALRSFVYEHDDLPAFHAGYLVLTFLTAALFNLGTFALLVVAHMSLDIVKYRDVHGFSWGRTAIATMKESIVDIMLLSVGLLFAVYLHHYAGMIAISGILRAEGTILRALGTIIPKLEVLYHLLFVITHLREHLQEIPEEVRRTGWARGEAFSFFTAGVCIFLVALAGPILGLSSQMLAMIYRRELIPWGL